MQKKILIVVPAFNEERNISIVLEEIRRSVPYSDILVINDCSQDLTSKAAREVSGVKVIDLPYNLGIGGAVQTGFKYAKRMQYEIVVQIDGDGQHVASEVDKLIDAMEKTDCDMIIGSRFLGVKSFKSTCGRRIGIKLFSCIYRLLIRTRITDGTSGFRAYNRKCIEFLAEHYPDDYPEPEAIVMLIKHGFKICEVGVEMRSRIYGRSSITPFKGVYYMIKVMLSILFSYIRTEG